MKSLYLECNMGASGDMIMAALLALVDDKSAFISRMNALNIPGVTLAIKDDKRSGISGLSVDVLIDGILEGEEHHHGEHTHEHTHERGHEHHHEHTHEHDHGHEHEHEHNSSHVHTGINDITSLINSLDLPDKVKKDALAIYSLLALAESASHGAAVEKIHFHEVGQLDAIADIVGCCMLFDELKPGKVLASPICLGFGMVKTAHGILSVPAPATAHILKNVPVYGGKIEGELCTPTGAAILKYFVEEFTVMPAMNISTIGHGLGKKEFPAANMLRAFLGEIAPAISGNAAGGNAAIGPNNTIVELSCNIDDMPGEQIGFLIEELLNGNALDAYITPIQMKKSRPGYLLTCLCNENNADNLAAQIFAHSTTFGIRKSVCEKYMLGVSFTKKETPYGELTLKTGQGYGVTKTKIEYDSIAALARQNGVSIQEILKQIIL